MKHSQINRHFGGYSVKHRKTCIYKCTNVDDNNVYVTNIVDPEECLALSPIAIGKTFHPAAKNNGPGDDPRWYVYFWNQYITP